MSRNSTVRAAAVIAFLCLAGSAAAQAPAPASPAPPPAGKDAPWAITDNSFLVEEAFNQDPKVVQNIVEFIQQSGGGDWLMTFTQEWPAPGKRHQLSYTITGASLGPHIGFSDVYLNYRYQVLEEGPGRAAFSPRVSAIIRSGDHVLGSDHDGLQVNLPFSKQHGDFYLHGNGGFTWLPRGKSADLLSPTLAGSAIYRVRPMLNLMLESVLTFGADDTPDGNVGYTQSLTISPGARGGWNVGEDTQIVVGAAMPITRTQGETSIGVLGYFSCELPFRKK